ncbi:hypothetical protein LWI28_017107 [Acer negundo]|uniref:Uncharacterized protein n=1 Tax=Acer negundo TaxID=4023 RepID=A0AAD5JQL5_ACENE|nr:hypothetical protein LWI28_017107 [Acer negundo]
MLPTAILPAESLVSSFPPSASLTGNVSISLRSSRPTDTPHLTQAKSQPSLPATLSTPPMARFPLSEMAARASRVRSIPRQVQRQASATSSMKPVDHSLVSPPPPPPPPPPLPLPLPFPPSPIIPTRRQLRVDQAKDVGTWTEVVLVYPDKVVRYQDLEAGYPGVAEGYPNIVVGYPEVGSSVSSQRMFNPLSTSPTLIPPHSTLIAMLARAARARGLPVKARRQAISSTTTPSNTTPTPPPPPPPPSPPLPMYLLDPKSR